MMSSGYHAFGCSTYKAETTFGMKKQIQASQAWWNFPKFDLTENSSSHHVSDTSDEDTWDLSDSLADLYRKDTEQTKVASKKIPVQNVHKTIHIDNWLLEDTSHGFITVFASYVTTWSSRLLPCTVSTNAQTISFQCGMPPDSLHVQFHGERISRMKLTDCPLAIQNDFLFNLGYSDLKRIQEEGTNEELYFLLKFHVGKPVHDGTYSRNQLSTQLLVRRGKVVYQWVWRLCVLSGTRLIIYGDKTSYSKQTVLQLAKGHVEEVQFKNHDKCLKLTSTINGERSVYFSFHSALIYNKWLKKAKKATAKLPTKADLSKYHLEYLPETVFINEDLQTLNLQHNALKERPTEDDIYSIGWLDDLVKFKKLQTLNLADNNLETFPPAICSITSLVELNVAGNKLEEIPSSIAELTRLKILHAHNNHLSKLPDEISCMKNLSCIVLAFNHFTTIPYTLLQLLNASETMDSITMPGNFINTLPRDLLLTMAQIKKIDFRMNKLTFLPAEILKFETLGCLTHLDISDNYIPDLDISSLKSLEFVNCDRNGLTNLQISGVCLKHLSVAHNDLEVLIIKPKPEWLINLNVSFNKIKFLPMWLGDCFLMVKLNISHNKLKSLPEQLFLGMKKLQILKANHNELTELPEIGGNLSLEEMHLQHNRLSQLPDAFLSAATKLKYLNASSNLLSTLPFPNENESLNKLQELYLTANCLKDGAINVICQFPRLKKLQLAQNCIQKILDSDISKLEALQELNISSNQLIVLPLYLCRHPKLQVLRANSNFIQHLPDFKNAKELKILEIGSNHLSDISVTQLMDSQVQLLDISGNPNLFVDVDELEGIKNRKRVCIIDMRGQNRSLPDLRRILKETPWQNGFSQTSGIRNRMCVAVLSKMRFTENGDALFGIFDGGRNEDVARRLADMMGEIIEKELKHPMTKDHYLKYAMLTAHRKLRSVGQKLGASVAICHIKKLSEDKDDYNLNVSNVGNVEVVLNRGGHAVCITRLFTVDKDREECERINNTDGIITEDGRVNGITISTRLLGCGYLYPQIIPSPHVKSLQIRAEDKFIIMANQELWRFLPYQEAVNKITQISDPVVAAKTLQDLAQGYGAKENLSVIVIHLQSSKHKNQQLPHKWSLNHSGVNRLFHEEISNKNEFSSKRSLNSIKEQNECDFVDNVDYFQETLPSDVYTNRNTSQLEPGASLVKPLSNRKFRKNADVSEWQDLLQYRLQEEIKNKELEHLFKGEVLENAKDAQVESESHSNWSTLTNQSVKKTSSQSHSINLSDIIPPPISENADDAAEAASTVPELPTVDRDAILFYKMQMARVSSGKTSSMTSIQSDHIYPSVEQILPQKTSSHSIEVLVQPNPQLLRHNHQKNLQSEKPTYENSSVDFISNTIPNENFYPVCIVNPDTNTMSSFSSGESSEIISYL